jgi:hypothetical protein
MAARRRLRRQSPVTSKNEIPLPRIAAPRRSNDLGKGVRTEHVLGDKQLQGPQVPLNAQAPRRLSCATDVDHDPAQTGLIWR